MVAGSRVAGTAGMGAAIALGAPIPGSLRSNERAIVAILLASQSGQPGRSPSIAQAAANAISKMMPPRRTILRPAPASGGPTLSPGTTSPWSLSSKLP